MLRILRPGVLRGLVLLLILAAWMAIAAVGGQAQGKLAQVQKNDSTSFLPASAESTRAAEAGEPFVDSTTLPALLVLENRDGGALTPPQVAAAGELASGLGRARLEGADPAAGDPATVGDLLTADPVAVPSQDGAAVLVPLSLDSDRASAPLANGEDAVDAAVTAVRDAVDGASASGLRGWVTGPAGFIADLSTAFAGIDGVLLAVALGAVLVILVLVYRSPLLPIVVIVTAVFGLTLAGLIVYQLAAGDVLTLNGQSQGIMSILVVGAAVDYSLLVVARYREELRHVQEPGEALWRALRASFPPVAASAGTVVAGLLCLLLSDLTSNRSLGPVAAIGIGSAFLAAMTLLPVLLLAFGRRSRVLFWPRVPRVVPAGTAAGAAPGGSAQPARGDAPADDGAAPSGVWERLAGWVTRHARPVWIGTAIVLAAGAAWVPTLDADGTSQSDVFLTDVDAVTGEQALAEHFPAGAVQPIIVIAPEAELDGVVSAARGTAGVASVTPLVAGAAAGTGAPADPDAPVRVENGLVRVDVATQAASDSQEATVVVQDLRDALAGPAPEALVGGAAAQKLDTQLTGERDLRVIVPAVLVVILVILMVLLRSVLAPVLLMGANVLSFATALGISAVVFTHVFHFPGADPVVPLFGFAFLVALGIDYSIFLMTRVHEESRTRGTRAAVRHSLAVTGGVITSAGVVLATTFAALAVLPLLFLAQLAFIVAFGVLVDTLVVRTLLVPALVHDVGRRVWWPSRLARGAD